MGHLKKILPLVAVAWIFAVQARADGGKFGWAIKDNSAFWSRPGWAYNPPRLDENGKTVMLVQDDSPERRFHRDFKNAGVKIHSTILFSGWVAPGKYDYSATDETLEKLFGGAGADIFYIPRIKLDPPPAWCAENPRDTAVYYPGNLSEGEIEKVAAKIRARKAEPMAEVLIVSDPESFYYFKPHWMLHQDMLKDSIIQIRQAGTPADHYRLADLKDLDLSGYKAVAFMNCVRIADSDWEKISKRLRPNATLIWHHAPAGCAVYADNRFTAFFPSRDAETKLSGKSAQKDLFTGEKYAVDQTVKLKTGRALILAPEE